MGGAAGRRRLSFKKMPQQKDFSSSFMRLSPTTNKARVVAMPFYFIFFRSGYSSAFCSSSSSTALC